MTSWTVQPEPVDSPTAVAVIRTYLTDIIGRYYGRPARSDEVDQAIADDPTDDLARFFVAGGTVWCEDVSGSAWLIPKRPS
ncbi:hypothetical protein [Saccharothrix deserti]|uniref:hypothetical protein n=1 Tax=Saccharothrix deserti TaxID=2593674 RepID=UPI0030841954